MQFRKINYLTLIYHFFTFRYTLGMYSKFNNEIYYRKAKMNVFFPLFTSLNNLEGRPLHLKKRPFALYYYSLFCRENLRETFLPFKFKSKTGLFMILFRYSTRNNFLFKKRVKKTNSYYFYKNFNDNLKKNFYLNNMFLYLFYLKSVFFFTKNLNSSLTILLKYLIKSQLKSKVDLFLVLKKRWKSIIFYRMKTVKLKKNSRQRNKNNIQFCSFENIYKFKCIKNNYVHSKK